MGESQGRHDDDEAGRLADDQAGGDCHEHPEPGDEGRRDSDEGEDHEEEVTTHKNQYGSKSNRHRGVGAGYAQLQQGK